MKKLVEYEINDDGNCEKCENKITDYLHRTFCIVFNDWLNRNMDHPKEQCFECSEYLAQDRSLQNDC